MVNRLRTWKTWEERKQGREAAARGGAARMSRIEITPGIDRILPRLASNRTDNDSCNNNNINGCSRSRRRLVVVVIIVAVGGIIIVVVVLVVV